MLHSSKSKKKLVSMNDKTFAIFCVVGTSATTQYLHPSAYTWYVRVPRPSTYTNLLIHGKYVCHDPVPTPICLYMVGTCATTQSLHPGAQGSKPLS